LCSRRTNGVYSKLEPLIKEYLRAEYSQDQIMTKINEAKSIFKLEKKKNAKNS